MKLRCQPGDKIGGLYQVHQALMGGMPLQGTGTQSARVGKVDLRLDLDTNLPFALKTFQGRFLTNPKLRKTSENEASRQGRQAIEVRSSLLMKNFFDWYAAPLRPPLNEATVQRYAAEPREQGVRASSIDQRLGAICKLAREGANSKSLPEPVAGGFKVVKGVRRERRRAENWLTREQAQQLINAPMRCVSKSGSQSIRLLGLQEPFAHLICLPKIC
jgi:hypothetical protein